MGVCIGLGRVLALPLAVLMMGPINATERDQAKLWFAGLSDAQRSAAAKDIHVLAPARQAIVLKYMSREERAAFWVSRLGTLKTGSSPAAQEALNQAIALFSSPEYQGAPLKFKDREAQLTKELIGHFGPALFEPALKSTGEHGVRFVEHPIAWLAGKLTVRASEDCDCSNEGPGSVCSIIGSEQGCVHQGNTCNVLEEECFVSIIELGACTGLCTVLVMD